MNNEMGSAGKKGPSLNNDKVGVGVIGCGIAKWHLEGFAADPRVDIIALSGLETDRCGELAQQFGVANVYADYRQLLDRPDISIVSIAVPNILHHQIGLDAIAAGKHVLMEKPLARNSREGQDLVDAARNAGVELGIIFNRRTRADMAVLRKHIQAGGLGDVYFAKAWWERRSGIPGLGSWFTSKNAAGGGPLIDLGVHVLDMVLWLMNDPEIVTVSASTYSEIGPQGKGNWGGNRFKVTEQQPYEVEDLAVAFMRTATGASIFLEAGWAAYTGATDEFGVALRGDRGGADLRVKDYATVDTLTLYSDIDGTPVDAKPRLVDKSPAAGHIETISNFVDAVLSGTPANPSGEDGLIRTTVIDAIYRSAEERREIDLRMADSLEASATA